MPGFEAALAAEDVDAALQAVKVEEAFAALLAKPLAALPPRPADAPRQVIILDALDELSAQQLGPVLDLITTCLVTLPEWLRLFVTSRDEAAIKAKLCAAGLEPEEVSSTMRAACCVLLATVAAMVSVAMSSSAMTAVSAAILASARLHHSAASVANAPQAFCAHTRTPRLVPLHDP